MRKRPITRYRWDMLTIKIATSLSMIRYLQLCESGKTRKLKNAGDAQWGALMYSARVPSHDLR